jgi:hypothetical protein
MIGNYCRVKPLFIVRVLTSNDYSKINDCNLCIIDNISAYIHIERLRSVCSVLTMAAFNLAICNSNHNHSLTTIRKYRLNGFDHFCELSIVKLQLLLHQ